MRKKEWNPSVNIPNLFEQEIDHKKKLLDIRIGLQNHKKTIFKKKKIPKGCDTRNDFNLSNGLYVLENNGYLRNSGSKPWNVSNFINNKDFKDNYHNIARKAELNTIHKEKILKNYINPLNFQNNYMEKLRNDKILNRNLMNKLKEKYIYDNPDATEEKILGGVYRMFNDYQQKQFQVSYQNNIKDTIQLKSLVKKKSRYYASLPKINNKSNSIKNQNTKIEDIIKKLQVLKNEKKKKKKLKWVYENY